MKYSGISYALEIKSIKFKIISLCSLIPSSFFVVQFQVLQSDQVEGQNKLESALEQGELAISSAEEEDNEIIEEEVAAVQDEFDCFV